MVIQIIVTLAVIGLLGLLLWAFDAVPMQPWVKRLINVIAAVAVVLWLLQILGLGHYLPRIR